MKQSISRAALAAALVLGAAAAAGAQRSPPPLPPVRPAPAAPATTPVAPVPPAPGAAAPRPPGMPDPAQIRREIRVRFASPDGGARALARAYRAIGEAEALNGRSPYVGQARTHYTSAYARYRRGDAAGTAAEATAAAALARAALDERPPYVPRGLEAPPTPAPRARAAGSPPAGAPPVGALPPGMPDLPRLQEIARLPQVLMMHRFDASSLQALVALENTPEVRSLADRATAAAASAERARAANDREGAQRQERLAHDLATAVRGITAADHPNQMPGRMPRRPLGASGALGMLDLDLSDLDLSGFDLPAPTRFELPDDFMDGLLVP
ncbi:MAG: hypothetical protein QOI11_2095 [Candidatus Eremiobacteraeota bacterium]|nr:hypothetical protein [Candidatus Eremiobacteraeota bacterium]